MESNKNIKIYGTLVNHTLDSNIADNTHNDAIAYAYQIYDDKFGATPNSANFQDEINKKLLQRIEELQALINSLQTALTNLEATVNNNIQNAVNNLQASIADVQSKQYWTLSQDGTKITAAKPAHAPGFYDTTI